MSFVSNIIGGILGANAAGKAANAGVTGAQQAQALEKTNQTNAVTAQDTALTNVTAAEQPYQSLGSTSANHLSDLLSKGFTAPTLAEAEQTPGYQFDLQTGTNAINENAAATGTLSTGNTGVALQKFGQGLAQNTYQQTYQDALNSYMANYNTLQGGTNTGLSSTGQLDQANLTTAGNSKLNTLAIAGSANAWTSNLDIANNKQNRTVLDVILLEPLAQRFVIDGLFCFVRGTLFGLFAHVLDFSVRHLA